jgi:hypothetical protein
MLVLMVALCISNLLLLIVQTLMKLAELLMNIVRQVLKHLSTLCRWAVGAKSTTSMSKKSQTSAWKEGGGLHPDYTSASLAMRGERSEKLDRAMRAPINPNKLRDKGL